MGEVFLHTGTTADDNFRMGFRFTIEFENLGIDLLADHRLKIVNTSDIDQALRKKGDSADIDQQAAFNSLPDCSRDPGSVFSGILHLLPNEQLVGPAFGEIVSSLFVLPDDNSLDTVADSECGQIALTADPDFVAADHALCLCADIDNE